MKLAWKELSPNQKKWILAGAAIGAAGLALAAALRRRRRKHKRAKTPSESE